ncbi:hypothetical protein CWM47_33230 [Spirosoma pollinicola]|uniref:Uncharacterized protein n=2 Tax=Spirosoma pollinicola TaxID=2057025 RepID=A0A2K8Z8T9_9BACT|nr:hypothetical protein CWM47_33230 [Spirosoma pollinicola]
MWVVGMTLCTPAAVAQSDTSTNRRLRLDSTHLKVRTLRQKAVQNGHIDSLLALKINALAPLRSERDSVFYTRLKTRMYKQRLTRQLYDAVFLRRLYVRRQPKVDRCG